MKKKLIIISPATKVDCEDYIYNILFEKGLSHLHIRKLNASEDVYRYIIENIDRKYRDRIIIHDYYKLVDEYNLGGIHIKSDKISDVSKSVLGNKSVSVSCHSLEDIEAIKFTPNYCFISPVFDSISKDGYKHKFSDEELGTIISKSKYPLIALGGINADNMAKCLNIGFAGVATIGYIWNNNPSDVINRFIRMNTTYALSIGGLDPSSGAGITSDIKTMEANGVYGLTVCSAITFQNENKYFGTNWISKEDICKQILAISQSHHIPYIKLGIMEDFDSIAYICNFIKQTLPYSKIIWDPILKTSSGNIFHKSNKGLQNILKNIFLVSPNTDEVFKLFGDNTNTSNLKNVCEEYNINILWKGGHNTGEYSSDLLINSEEIHKLDILRSNGSKHGTGCVLSSSICAYLSIGFDLKTSCQKAQQYVSNFINSSSGLLGRHKSLKVKSNFKDKLILQYITHYSNNISFCKQIENVCKGGIRWVQLRMKDASDEDFIETARLAKNICDRYDAIFIINDRVDIAKLVDADGVHIGKNDMSSKEARQILGQDKIIGSTANTEADIISVMEHSDYVGLGPYKYTTTKKNLSPVIGIEGYKQIASSIKDIPIVAIGGICDDDIIPILETDVYGIALSSYILNSEDMVQTTRNITNKIKKWKN